MSAENNVSTKESIFSIENETIVIERFGKNDYAANLINSDCSVRGTLLEIFTELQKNGLDLSKAVPLPEEGNA